jgi:hypothetical protein
MAIQSFKANGNITPASFVKLDTSGDGLVALAGAGEKVVGVSQAGTRRTPYESLDDGYAAIAGEDLEVFGIGEECWLQIAGTITQGDRLKSDASGYGVAVASNNDEYGAVARQAGVSGQLIRVQVIPFSQYGA